MNKLMELNNIDINMLTTILANFDKFKEKSNVEINELDLIYKIFFDTDSKELNFTINDLTDEQIKFIRKIAPTAMTLFPESDYLSDRVKNTSDVTAMGVHIILLDLINNNIDRMIGYENEIVDLQREIYKIKNPFNSSKKKMLDRIKRCEGKIYELTMYTSMNVYELLETTMVGNLSREVLEENKIWIRLKEFDKEHNYKIKNHTMFNSNYDLKEINIE